MAETSPGRLTNLITEATEGRLGLRLEPEDFVYIDRDCQRFIDLIRTMQAEAQAIADIEDAQWGIGANSQILTSAKTLVSWFRDKAKGIDNSVHAILEQHYVIVKDIKDLHEAIRKRYEQTDTDFAARVKTLLAELPENPTPIDYTKSGPGVGQPEVRTPQGTPS